MRLNDDLALFSRLANARSIYTKADTIDADTNIAIDEDLGIDLAAPDRILSVVRFADGRVRVVDNKKWISEFICKNDSII